MMLLQLLGVTLLAMAARIGWALGSKLASTVGLK
jgi:hypothetical protein